MSYDIIVAVDTSEASRRAVEIACAMCAAGLGGSLLLVHVVQWSGFSMATPQDNEQRHHERQLELDAATADVLEPLRQFAGERGVEADVLVRHGDREHILDGLAAKNEAKFLVVGRTGDTKLRDRVFGGLPAHLVKSSPVPVVVVP